MIRSGLVEEGLEVVRHCRARYDGRVRNPSYRRPSYFRPRQVRRFAFLVVFTELAESRPAVVFRDNFEAENSAEAKAIAGDCDACADEQP